MNETRKKDTKLKEKILLKMARNGAQSKTSLKETLQKHYSVISNIVDSLEYDGLVIFTGNKVPEEKRRGVYRILYHLTNKGISYVSQLGLTAEEFWDLLKNTYNNYPNSNLIPIDNLLSDFEKRTVPISIKHIPLLWKNFYVDYFDSQDKNEIVKMILLMFAKDSALSENQIVNRIKLENDNKLTSQEKQLIHEVIEKSLENFWIAFDSKNKLRLSHLGLLWVFNKLRGIFILPDNKIVPNNLILIENLKNNYVTLLPKIFNHWNELRSIFDNRAMVEMMIYFVERYTEFMHTEFQDQNSLFASLDRMAEKLVDYANNQINACMKILEDIKVIPSDKITIQKIHAWLLEGKVTKLPTIRKELIPMLDIILKCIEIIEKYSCFLTYENAISQLNKIGLEPSHIMRRQVAEPILENVISFQFFTIFVQNMNDNPYWSWRKYEMHSNSDPIGIRRFNSSESRSSWNGFLQTNTKLTDWYNEWIHAITNFETENLEKIKQTTLRI